jgi:E3 ubiquitin-protein ligase MARCH5
VDEKQQGNSSIEVACPQCSSTYIIVYPKSGMFVRLLDIFDRIINKACPFLAGGILVGSVYWTAVTYGAVTIMQVLGHKEGLNVMEKADPLIMLIGLPTIPVMLMLGRLIRWEDALLKFWRKHSTKLPLFNLILPNSNQYLPRMPAVAHSSNSDPVSFTRTICGGLILPTIATIVGKLLFQRINSNFQRSIIVSILGFIASFFYWSFFTR